MCRLALIGLTTIALLIGASHIRIAAAEDGPGTRAVRRANATITALLKQKAAPGSADEKRLAAQVTSSVRDFLDVDALGRRALTDHWQGLTKAQKSQFLALLRQLIEGNYVKGLRANLEYQVAYTGEKEKGDDLIVSTEIKTKRRGRPYTIAIDYVLRKDGKNLRAFDIVTDGVGLVENYRAQFNRIIAKRGFDDLIARMKRKAEKTQQ
ncbi:MAG: ABC transporter substrate-binding protein [Proteobacteria bacterium]|nr:ABC transporter substrate-binding protein [Pseudomonadota bacterium]